MSVADPSSGGEAESGDGTAAVANPVTGDRISATATARLPELAAASSPQVWEHAETENTQREPTRASARSSSPQSWRGSGYGAGQEAGAVGLHGLTLELGESQQAHA